MHVSWSWEVGGVPLYVPDLTEYSPTQDRVSVDWVGVPRDSGVGSDEIILKIFVTIPLIESALEINE